MSVNQEVQGLRITIHGICIGYIGVVPSSDTTYGKTVFPSGPGAGPRYAEKAL